MKPDGTDSFSTASEDARLLKGTQVTGSTDTVGAEVKLCTLPPPYTPPPSVSSMPILIIWIVASAVASPASST